MTPDTDPHLQDRPAVRFVGTTAGVTLSTLAQIADRIPELAGALVGQGTPPAAAPFFRYLEMKGESMTVQVGVPVLDGVFLPAHVVPFPVVTDTLPAGRYACLTHTGPFDGLFGATERLLNWARDEDLTFEMDTVDGVERWAARLEIYLTDPRIETDPSRFQTELAFKLAG